MRVTTELVRRYGRSLSGTRLRDHTPCSHWETHIVVAALRLDGLTVHKQPAVRVAIEAVVAQLRFLLQGYERCF
jgi:hypothetical protein